MARALTVGLLASNIPIFKFNQSVRKLLVHGLRGGIILGTGYRILSILCMYSLIDAETNGWGTGTYTWILQSSPAFDRDY
jgi:hypothetical protein